MFVEICGEYFNIEDIKHLWCGVGVPDTICLELRNGDEYQLPFFAKNYKVSSEEYLKQLIDGINMSLGREKII